MAKTLLDILSQPFPKSESKTPNEKGMTPLPQEPGARAFLKTLKVSAHPDPYGNDDSFSAKDVSVFQRAKNNYGYDYKTQGDFNDQGAPNKHVLRNPTLNVSNEEAFIAVDSVGLGFVVDYRVVNKLTNEYVTRKMHKEEAEELAAELNAEFEEILIQEGWAERPHKRASSAHLTQINLDPKTGNPATAHDHGIKAVAKALFHTRYKYRDSSSKNRRFGDNRKAGAKGMDIYAKKHNYQTGQPVVKEHSEELDESVTRKHFREVANTVRAIEDPKERQTFANHHAAIFARQNPRFDHEKFHAAAGTHYDGKGVGSKPWREETELTEASRKLVLNYAGMKKEVLAAQRAAKKKKPVTKGGLSPSNFSRGRSFKAPVKEGTKYLSDIMEGWAEKVVSRIHKFKTGKSKVGNKGSNYRGSINIDPKSGNPAGPEDRAMMAISQLRGNHRVLYRTAKPNRSGGSGNGPKKGAYGADLYSDTRSRRTTDNLRSRWKKRTNESEQLDELSKKTLKSYKAKSAKDSDKMLMTSDATWSKNKKQFQRRLEKRSTGRVRANERLKGSMTVKYKGK